MLASKKGDRARYGAGRSPSVASQIFGASGAPTSVQVY
nr:MAG TPA: hypothetical protein [Caudoviricetes sp.]